MQSNHGEHDQMNLLFRLFDVDDDGYISELELRAMLERLGNDISDKDLSNMMKAADVDGDGRISQQEFVVMMTGWCTEDENKERGMEVAQTSVIQEVNEGESTGAETAAECECCEPVKDDDNTTNRRIRQRRKSVLSLFSRSKKKASTPERTLRPRASCPNLSLMAVSPPLNFADRRTSSHKTKSSPKFSDLRMSIIRRKSQK